MRWCQVQGLQEELSKATAISAAAAARSEASTSPSPPDSLDIKTETTVLGGLASAASPASATKELGNRSGSVEAWVDESGSGLSPAQQKAQELAGAERELENVREREKDAKGEAERLADELERARWGVCGPLRLGLPGERASMQVSRLAFDFFGLF